MGFFFSKIWNKLFGTKDHYKILILGLQNVGKTTILYQLNLGKVISTSPTVGSNVEEVVNKNVKLQVWDIGGQESIRTVWHAYYSQTDAVIYVIDSSDKKNEDISIKEFQTLVQQEVLMNAVFLVFANKQDQKDAMNAAEITEKYKLGEIKTHTWHIQACSAINGEGLHEGLDWLTDRILEKNKKK